MGPHELAQALSRAVGAPVRLRPSAEDPALVWGTTVLRDHAHDAAGTARVRAVLAAAPGARVCGERVELVLTRAQAQGAAAAIAPPVRAPLLDPGPHAPVVLTRDGGRRTTRAGLVRLAGEPSARWALVRSADGRQVDVPLAALRSLRAENPLVPVLLAAQRLERDPPARAPDDALAALVLAWPQAVDEHARTGRTRPLAGHVERLAAAVLHWDRPRRGAAGPVTAGGPTAGVGPAATAAWTPQPWIGAARIVLHAGAALAGLAHPPRL